jgi:UPF0755 protein
MLYGFVLINQIFSDNTKFTEKTVYVPTDANYDQTISLVIPLMVNMKVYNGCRQNELSYCMKSGRFLLKRMNSYELVKAMRSNIAY